MIQERTRWYVEVITVTGQLATLSVDGRMSWLSKQSAQRHAREYREKWTLAAVVKEW
jgi:hypothetical protein